MDKISLRWRITLVMGALLLSVCVLLTALSIQNMSNSFAVPILYAAAEGEKSQEASVEEEIRIYDPSQPPTIAFHVAEIQQEIVIAQRTFSMTSYFYMILVVVGGMVAAYYLAGRAMGPIAKLNHEISAIDVNNLSKRISVPQTKDEIETLSRSFNQLLTRLEQDFEKEKRFSANAAHELKTPLATIMTSTQVLAMHEHNSETDYREHLQVTLQSVRRLSRVVDGLLLLGGAALDVPFEEVDVAQMLYGIEAELIPLYGEETVTRLYDLQPITLRGNPELLYRAFFNLVENAWKYAGKQGAVTITSHHDQRGSIICIANTAVIPAADLPHIFEPFYRADKSRSRKIAGAGLGLSIAQEIFHLHQAAISIHSDPDMGTIVEVGFGC